MATDFRDLLPGLAALVDPARGADLAEVSSIVGLSPSHAQRVITRAIGESPKRFQQRTKLELGAVLLLATEARIADVAFASGFGSHESFTRSFRERFGEGPSEWRRSRRRFSIEQANLATSTSRCIGLYRRPLGRLRDDRPALRSSSPTTSRKDTALSHEIEIRTVEPIPMLYQVRRVEPAAVAEVLADVLPAVFGYAIESGSAPAGHPFVRHVGRSPAFITIEAGVPLVATPEAAPPEDSGILVGELPGGTVAATTHKGPYEGLGEAYEALDRWVTESDYESAGHPWELYVTDPGEVPDPADWLTDVFWPVTDG